MRRLLLLTLVLVGCALGAGYPRLVFGIGAFHGDTLPDSVYTTRHEMTAAIAASAWDSLMSNAGWGILLTYSADTMTIAVAFDSLHDSFPTWQDMADSIAASSGSVDTFLLGYGLAGAGTYIHAGDSLAVDDTVIPSFQDLSDSVNFYATDPPIAGWGIEIHDDTAGHNRVSVNRTDTDTAYLAIGGQAATVATIAGLTADTTAGGAARATLAANATQLGGHDSTYYLPGISRTIEMDEFTAGLTSSTAVGDLGWPTTGSIVEKAGETNHPGILTLSTTAIANAVSSLQRNFMYLTDEGRVSLLMRPLSGSTVMGFRFGLLDTQLTLETSKGVYFSFLAESSANWRTVTRDGSGITRNTSATAYTPGSWYLLEIVKSGTDYLFYINSVLKATHTTNIYAGSVRPMIVLLTREAVAKSVDLDWYYSGTGTLTR